MRKIRPIAFSADFSSLGVYLKKGSQHVATLSLSAVACLDHRPSRSAAPRFDFFLRLLAPLPLQSSMVPIRVPGRFGTDFPMVSSCCFLFWFTAMFFTPYSKVRVLQSPNTAHSEPGVAHFG